MTIESDLHIAEVETQRSIAQANLLIARRRTRRLEAALKKRAHRTGVIAILTKDQARITLRLLGRAHFETNSEWKAAQGARDRIKEGLGE